MASTSAYQAASRPKNFLSETLNSCSVSFAYDPVGNRLTKNSTTYTYDRADRLLIAGSTSYTVNDNGNLVARGSDSFVYDQANRLASATIGTGSGASTNTYSYNGYEKRAGMSVGSTTTSFVYDVNGSLPNVLTDGTLKYVYGLGLAYAVDGSGNAQVYHTDGLGSVRAITDSLGSVVATYTTDEFGIPTQTQGSSTQPFQFTGQQNDPESGLYYLRARMYDPSIGRFLSRDPMFGSLSSPLSLDRFSYVQNNPLTMMNPSGLALVLDDSYRKTGHVEFGETSPGSLPDNNQGHSCSDGNPLTFCKVTAVGPGGVAITGILLDPCVFTVWTCDKGEGNGGSGNWIDRIKTTAHGRESLLEEKWSEAQYLAAKEGNRMERADGASVYIAKVGKDRFNVVIEDSESGVITAIKGKTQFELDHLAGNYGWHYP